jgi:hypothetical protein
VADAAVVSGDVDIDLAFVIGEPDGDGSAPVDREPVSV